MVTGISALILAAGRSTRMGVPKMLLPWGQSTVIRTIINKALNAELSPVVVVTGAYQALLDEELAPFTPGISIVHNEEFTQHDMFYSVKKGISHLMDKCEAVMLFLGDQPHISLRIISDMGSLFYSQRPGILIPSYNMRRGHPTLIHHRFFQEILSMPNESNLKVFLASHEHEIQYLTIQDNSVLEDIDSPEGYQRLKNEYLD